MGDVTVAAVAYTAGIIDGEGTIHCYRMPKEKRLRARYDYYRITTHVTNTDQRLLTWLKTMWGGYVYENGPPQKAQHKPSWRWALQPVDTVPFLEAVLPFLLIKREVAEAAVTLRKLYKMGGRHRLITQEEQNERQSLFETIKRLNKRGLSESEMEEQ